jgi:hypothetical protein
LHIDYTPLLKKMTFSKMQAFFSMSSFFFVVTRSVRKKKVITMFYNKQACYKT